MDTMGTTDLYCAAYLMARGHEAKGVRPSARNTRYQEVLFPFEARPDMLEYYAGAFIPARRLATAMRTVIAMVRRREQEAAA